MSELLVAFPENEATFFQRPFHHVNQGESTLAEVDADLVGFMVFVRLALGLVQLHFFFVDRLTQFGNRVGELLLGKNTARSAFLVNNLEQGVQMLGEHDDFA